MRIILPPLKWDQTTGGLDTSDYVRFTEDYQRSLLPPDTVFPREGQIWEAVRDCQVDFEAPILRPCPRFSKLRLPDGSEVTLPGTVPLTEFARPPWGTARLPKGERVRVLGGTHFSSFAGPKALRASLQPLRYEELHESIVPPELRRAHGYEGYRLCVSTARPKWCLYKEQTYLNQDFRLVEDVA